MKKPLRVWNMPDGGYWAQFDDGKWYGSILAFDPEKSKYRWAKSLDQQSDLAIKEIKELAGRAPDWTRAGGAVSSLPQSTDQHLCNCDLRLLLARGCQCGGR